MSSPSPPDTCVGTRTNGEPCSDDPIPGLDVCHRHLEQSDAVEPVEATDDRPVWERQAAEHLGSTDRGRTV